MTHTMRLHPEPFDAIKNGSKTIELRLNDEKRRLITIGDTIVFFCTEDERCLQVKVINLFAFKTFADLYNTLPLEKCGYRKENLASASFHDMYQYYTLEQEKCHGVLGIEIQVH